MVLSRWKQYFYDSFFEFRYHAYIELSWYFSFFVFVSLGVAAFSYLNIDSDVSTSFFGKTKWSCENANKFLYLSTFAHLIEAAAHIGLAATIASVMRSATMAYGGLTSMFAFFTSMIIKTGVLTLGLVWLFNNDTWRCDNKDPSLIGGSKLVLYVAAGVLGFQLFVGFFLMVSCGMKQAIYESLYTISHYAEISQDNYDKVVSAGEYSDESEIESDLFDDKQGRKRKSKVTHRRGKDVSDFTDIGLRDESDSEEDVDNEHEALMSRSKQHHHHHEHTTSYDDDDDYNSHSTGYVHDHGYHDSYDSDDGFLDV